MHRPPSLSRILGATAIAIGSAVLLGWWFQIRPLATVLPGWPTTKPDTAFGILILGVALLLRPDEVQATKSRSARYGAVVACLAVVITLVQLLHLAGVTDFVPARLLLLGRAGFPEGVGAGMTVLSSVAIIFLGLGVALIAVPRLLSVIQIGMVFIVVLLGIPLLNGLFSVGGLAFRSYEPFVSLALPTSIGILLVALGGLALRPRQGPLNLVTGGSSGAKMMRRLLPQVTIALLLVTWGTNAAVRRGYFDLQLAAAITLMMAILVAVALLWWNALLVAKAEAEAERFFSLGGDMFCVADTSGHFLRLNPAFTTVLGWSLKELEGQPFLRFVHPDDAPKTTAATVGLSQGEGVEHFENRYQCKDGSWRWLSWNAQATAHDGRIYATARDITELKSTQLELSEREEDLRVTLASIGDGVLVTDQHACIVRLNPAAEVLTGWAEGAALGRPVGEVFVIINEYTRQSGHVPIQDVLSTGEIRGLANHTVLIARDGVERPIADSAAPVRGPDGMVRGAVMVFREVAAERAAERALERSAEQLEAQVQERTAELSKTLEHLQESEERFATLFESAPDALLTIDEKGCIVATNIQAATLFRWNRTELFGQPLSVLIPGSLSETPDETHSRGNTLFGVGASGGAPTEWLALRSDGTEFVAAVTLARIIAGDVHHLVVSIRDVTGRLEMEAALRRSESQYRHLVEGASEVFYQVNVARLPGTSGLEFISQRTEEITGYPAEDFLADATLWERLVHPDDLGNTKAATRRALGEKAAITRLYRIQARDGETHWIEDRITPTFNRQGVLQGFTGVARDITPQFQLEEQLRQSQKMESIGRLAGGIAHDFNNLLTVIINTLESGRESLPPDSAIHQDMIEAGHAADGAARLTRQLLAFSRQQLLQPQFVDLIVLVEKMVGLLRRLIGEDISIDFEPHIMVAPVKVDPSQIEQVIVNLAVNARDAMPTGGTLTIRVGEVFLDDEYVATHPLARSGPHVMLSVADTGTGMNESTKGKIFEPFFTTKAPSEGTGLGLSTVYGIVRQSGGTIWVYSEPGMGTIFKLYFPVARTTEVDQTEVPALELSSPRGSETVLVVEDQDLVRGLATRILSNDGYRVLQAANGTEALEILGTHDGGVTLLFTDMVMPGMDGRELATKATMLQPEMRVLFTSGYFDEAAKHNGDLDRDGAPVLSKPYSKAELLRMVRKVLDS